MHVLCCCMKSLDSFVRRFGVLSGVMDDLTTFKIRAACISDATDIIKLLAQAAVTILEVIYLHGHPAT